MFAKLRIFKKRNKKCALNISDIEDSNKKSIMDTNRKTGFMGFVVYLTSLLNMYNDLIVTAQLQFILTYKISQDHLEIFFPSLRKEEDTIITHLPFNFKSLTSVF